ncbi:MAG TPA: phosphatase PAP2 family protein [Nocardioidaceae bacterium]|nr:phosphatase PAP2 family protein [Nocardioidaceae bacterium]
MLFALLFATLVRPYWTPDVVFLVLLSIAVAFGQARPFLFRLLPFLGLLALYQGFRSVADDLNEKVNFAAMIEADRLLFRGALPTHVLQEWWWSGSVRWHDFFFYGLYTIHFLTPFLLAVIIWKYRDHFYWRYLGAFVALNFAAFATYLVFPAAPPWMASELGHIEPLTQIQRDIWGVMGLSYSQLYPRMSPNLVAAVPSLHSAYPLLIALVASRLFGIRRTLWIFAYPAAMWIGVVYLGEHYVIDVFLGAVYAGAAFLLVTIPFLRIRRSAPQPAGVITLNRDTDNPVVADIRETATERAGRGRINETVNGVLGPGTSLCPNRRSKELGLSDAGRESATG